MKIIGIDQIDAFKKKHSDGKNSIESWYAEVKNSHWDRPSDIKQRYRSVDFLGDNKAIFNIGGNKYRLVVKIAYNLQIIKIIWIGTHSEYERKNF